MKRISLCLKDILITISIMCASVLISLLFQHVFHVQDHVTDVFIFAVFLISLWTNGHFYGIAAAFLAAVVVNYAFTSPFYLLNFTEPENVVSAVVMIVIAALTSALTTKIKHHEAVKRESEKERMRANLLRAVSHDLRTPLTTIYGSSAALLEKRDSLTEEQSVKIIKGIKEDAEWLVRMVENLLSITRIDSGKVKIIKTPTVLDELIDSVILKFKKRYPGQNVNLQLPDEIVIIPMDALLIEQVLINLLENAVQHAVGMKQLSLKVFTLANQAIFEIQDDGCGIEPERLGKIFLGYYESKEEPADSQKKNAGIGLSVCSTIIRAHGGDIKAENVKSGGAVFRFTLNTEEIESDEE